MMPAAHKVAANRLRIVLSEACSIDVGLQMIERLVYLAMRRCKRIRRLGCVLDRAEVESSPYIQINRGLCKSAAWSEHFFTAEPLPVVHEQPPALQNVPVNDTLSLGPWRVHSRLSLVWRIQRWISVRTIHFENSLEGTWPMIVLCRATHVVVPILVVRTPLDANLPASPGGYSGAKH